MVIVLMRRRPLSLAILLAVVFTHPLRVLSGDNRPKTVADAVKYSNTLSSREMITYAKDLADRKDFKSLRAIALADCKNSFIAARSLSEALPSTEAVAFCASLPINSMGWRGAMYGLRKHPKEQVIGYIKQLATSSLPDVRWCCYDVCQAESWDDLLENARNDLGNRARLNVPKLFVSTIGEAANLYIEMLGKDRPKEKKK
jgi:hypothetical protein